MNAMNLMPLSGDSFLLINYNLFEHWDEVPQKVEMGHRLVCWCTSSDLSVSQYARATIARILGSVRERDDSWVTLASRVFGLPERDLWDNIALGGDNVLLAILIHVAPQYLHSDHYDYLVLKEFSKLDTRNTHPRLQHDFCTIWNEIAQEARNQGPSFAPVSILYWIRQAYIALHQGTDAALTAFSASTPNWEDILFEPSSYPLCNLASHRPDSINFHEVPLPTSPGNSPDALSSSTTDASSTVPQQAMQSNIIAGLPAPSSPTTTSEDRGTSHGPNTTPPTNTVHSSSRPTSASRTVAVAATSFLPLEGSERQDSDIVSELGTSQNLFTASTYATTHTLAPIPTFLPNAPSESYDTGVASVSNSSHFAVPDFRAVPFLAQPNDDSTPLILGPPSPSDPMTIPEIRDTSQAFTTIPIAPQVDSGGTHSTFASPPPAGSHHDSHEQSQTIPMEVYRHQAPDIVLDSLEYGGRQHGLN